MRNMTGPHAPGEFTSSAETSSHPSFASTSSAFREPVTWKEQGGEKEKGDYPQCFYFHGPDLSWSRKFRPNETRPG
jgi:hypothetical protein